MGAFGGLIMDDRTVASGGTCLAAPPAQDVLKTALGAHQAGRLAEAAALYSRILTGQPSNVAALHLLGMVCHQQGDHARAVELIGHAVALRPDVAVIQAGLADALLATGRHQEAADTARTALRLGANDPNVRWILGQALGALGSHEEAVKQLVEAVRLKPDFAEAFNSLGNALRAVGRLEEAKAAYQTAIRLAPTLAAPHGNLGAVLLEEAHHEEAHALLERAVTLEPSRSSFWENLAEVFEREDQYDAAVPCRERVLALSSGRQAGPHIALGRALRKDDRPADAENHFRQAVLLEPELPDAWFHLGVLHEEQGDFLRAERCFREALRLQPEHDLARARLATLCRETLSDRDRAALEDRLATAAIDPEPRVRLLFSLGRVLDARGEYAAAAARLREANALSQTLVRGDRRFRPEALERFFDDTVATFTPEFFAKTAGAGLDSRRPVFVIGLPRSGTTLIEQVLASHPRIHGAGELSLAQYHFESLPSFLDTDATPMACVAQLQAIQVRNLAGIYFQQIRQLGDAQTERVVDKMPENYKHLGLLHILFPSATIIHCRRDLRDVALSCWMADFLHVAWASDPAHIAATFRSYLRLMAHWRAVLPATIHEVDYHETVSDLEGVARRLIAAMGLEWDPACLEFHRTRRTIRTGSIHQVRQPLYQRSVGRWKYYEHALADLFAALPESA